MSMICMVVASDLKVESSHFEDVIRENTRRFHLGVFFNDNEDMELLSDNTEDCIICSLADNEVYNNCDRLMLPDGCWFNGYTNKVPFQLRMSTICSIINDIMSMCNHVELYVGESGANSIDDFVSFDLKLCDFVSFMVRHFNHYSSDAFCFMLNK